MPKKKHTPEQVIDKLREAEVAISSGSTVTDTCRQIGETEQMFAGGATSTMAEDRPGRVSEAA